MVRLPKWQRHCSHAYLLRGTALILFQSQISTARSQNATRETQQNRDSSNQPAISFPTSASHKSYHQALDIARTKPSRPPHPHPSKTPTMSTQSTASRVHWTEEEDYLLMSEFLRVSILRTDLLTYTWNDAARAMNLEMTRRAQASGQSVLRTYTYYSLRNRWIWLQSH